MKNVKKNTSVFGMKNAKLVFGRRGWSTWLGQNDPKLFSSKIQIEDSLNSRMRRNYTNQIQVMTVTSRKDTGGILAPSVTIMAIQESLILKHIIFHHSWGIFCHANSCQMIWKRFPHSKDATVFLFFGGNSQVENKLCKKIRLQLHGLHTGKLWLEKTK